MKVVECELAMMKAKKIAINLYMLHKSTYHEVEISIANSRKELTIM